MKFKCEKITCTAGNAEDNLWVTCIRLRLSFLRRKATRSNITLQLYFKLHLLFQGHDKLCPKFVSNYKQTRNDESEILTICILLIVSAICTIMPTEIL